MLKTLSSFDSDVSSLAILFTNETGITNCMTVRCQPVDSVKPVICNLLIATENTHLTDGSLERRSASG